MTSQIAISQQKKLLSDYVNTFIGTDDMLHTFSGAAVPFGFIQPSLDNDTSKYSYGNGYNAEAYRYCAGYQYSDKTTENYSEKNIYIKAVFPNDKKLEKSYIAHKDIINGGELKFIMS